MNTLVKNILVGCGCSAIGFASGYLLFHYKLRKTEELALKCEDIADRAVKGLAERDAEISRLNEVINANHETYTEVALCTDDYKIINDLRDHTDNYISKKLMDRSEELYHLYRGYCRTVANDPSKAENELKRCEDMMQMAMYDAHAPIDDKKEKEFDNVMGRHNNPDECLFFNSGLDPEEKMHIVSNVRKYVPKFMLLGGVKEISEREYAREFDSSDDDIDRFKEFTIDISLREITDLYDGMTEELTSAEVAMCTLYYAWLVNEYSSADIPPQYFYEPSKKRYTCYYFEEIDAEDFARLVNEVALCTIDDITHRFPCPMSDWDPYNVGTPGDQLRRALIYGFRAED